MALPNGAESRLLSLLLKGLGVADEAPPAMLVEEEAEGMGGVEKVTEGFL